jgi:hypothetical protein
MWKFILVFVSIIFMQPHETLAWQRHSIGSSWWPIYLAVDDLDENGFLDVAVGSIASGGGVAWAASEIAWFENAGCATFNKKIVYPDVPPPDPIHNSQGLVTADFDKDGQKDIAVASGQYTKFKGGVHWFKSPDNFQDVLWTHHEVLPETEANSFAKIYTVDANQDTWPDIVVGGNDKAYILLNPADAALEEAWEKVPLEPNSGSTVNLADIDQDGTVDILNTQLRALYASQPIDIQSPGSGTHTIFNNKNGDNATLFPEDINSGQETITVDPAFYLACKSGDVAILLSTGDLPAPLSSSYEYYIIKTAETDRIQLAKRTGEVSWFYIINNNGAVTTQRHAIDTDVMLPFDAMAMDINGDPYPDVVISTFTPQSGVFWYENPGSEGDVWSKNTINADFKGSDIFVGDINGDGQDDLFASGLFVDKISWFSYEWVDSTAVWTEHVVDPQFVLPGDNSLNDIDGDGDLDILINAIGDHEVVWYENELVYNPGQEDVDNDTLGDVCDEDTIYGTISGDVQEGITVNIYILSCGVPQPHATVTTDEQGYYAIGALANGRYLVGPDDAGYSFSNSKWVDIPQEPIQAYNFIATSIVVP